MIKFLLSLFFVVLSFFSFSQNIQRERIPSEENPKDSEALKYLFQAEGPFSKFNISQEETSLRTENSKHFKNSDGSYTAVVGAGPMHYKENGEWLTMLSYILQNKSNEYKDRHLSVIHNQHKIFFPEKPGKSVITKINNQIYEDWEQPTMVWLDVNGKVIKKIQARSTSKGKANKDSLVFENIFPYVDAIILNSTTSKKLNYIINNPLIFNSKPLDAVYLAFSENIKTSDDWKLTGNESKNEMLALNEISILYQDIKFTSSGESILEINRPLYYERISSGSCEEPGFDSTKTNPDGYLQGNFLIKNQGGGKYTTFTLIPLDWLTSSWRKFPVTIDPVTNYYPGGTFPTYTANRSGNSGSWECFAGTYAGRTYQFDISYGWVDDTWPFSNPYMDGYASFNIAAIPDNATINSATTYWYRYGGRTCDNAIVLKHGMVQYNEHLAQSYDCNLDGNRVRNNNAYYNGTGKNATGWQSQTASTSNVTTALTADQITMGWAYNGGDDCCTGCVFGVCACSGNDGDYHHIYGYQNSTNKPYIVIDYCVKPSISAHPQDRSICTNGTMTAISVTASGTALTYQWQISNNTACSGAANWQNISGATSSSYTPPKIAGTRLYRVVVTASDCPSSLSGRTIYSNCARVTVNIMNGTSTNTTIPYGSGDNPPSIVFSNCGGLVLPGSGHIIGTVQPPTVGAVNNITSYTWAATGGTFTGTGSSVTWTAPLAIGDYTLSVTYNTTCGSFLSTCLVEVGSPNCNYAYVRPAASGGVDASDKGGPDNPYATLAYAVSQLGGRTHIRMATGSYTEIQRVNIPTNVIIEGRFDAANNWKKVNNSSTNITFSNVAGNISTSGNSRHLIGFASNGTTGWTLQDLNVTTNAVSGTHNGFGSSNYALWMNGASGYNIIRCAFNAGTATAGSNGTVGDAGSNGSPGGNGFNGSCDGGYGSGASAVTGPGSGIRKGGNGGAGGRGGSEGNNSGISGSAGSAGGGGQAGDSSPGGGGGGANCNSGWTSCGGRAGGTGGSASGSISTQEAANGLAGTNGLAGASGTFSIYFIPGAQGDSGTDGRGGGGGAGGGGGGGQGGCGCDDGGGNGAGAGGAGGEGGAGGTGGFGGGSSFGIYSNSSSGTITSSTVSSGTLGGGGLSGGGGAAGTGGNGGTGAGNCTGEIGRGGNGSKGGNGGAGGAGGAGANGVSYPYCVNGANTSLPAGNGSIPITPIVNILLEKGKPCINSEITLWKESIASAWTVPSGLTFVNDKNEASGTTGTNYDAADQTIKVYTSTINGIYSLTAPATFPSFLRIASDNRPLPTITRTPTSLCVGSGAEIQFNHTNSYGTQVEYEWVIFSATGNDANSPLITSNLNNPLIDVSSLAVGSYKVRYRVKEICCGWSRPVYTTFIIAAQPTQPSNLTKTTASNYTQVCEGATNLSVNTATGSTGGVTCVYEYSYQNTDDVWSAWQTTIPVVTAGSAPGYVRIKARTNCSGIACNESSETPYVEWEVVGQPVAGGVTRSSPVEQFVCKGVSLTPTVSGGSGGISSSDVIQWRKDTLASWNTYSSAISTSTNGTGVYYFRTQRTSTGYGCVSSSWEPTGNGAQLWFVDDPTVAPTITKNPSNATVCVGADLTINVTQFGSGGSGTCNDEIRYYNGSSWSSWSTSIPTITAITAGTYTIQARRKCSGGGCDSTANQVSWTVVADPTWQNNSLTPTTVCVGGSNTFSATTLGGVSGTISWVKATTSGGLGTSVTSPHTNTSSGTYYFRPVYTTTIAGCNLADGAETIVTVADDPTWNTNSASPTDACLGSNVTLSATITGGSGGTLSWIRAATPGGSGTTVTSPNNITSLGTFYYRPVYTPTVSGCNLADGTETTVSVTQPNLTNINSTVTPVMATGDYLWNGLSSNNWATIGNWYVLNGINFDLAAALPITTDDVYIVSYSIAQQCVSDVNNANIASANTSNSNNIYIGAGATLDALGTLNVYGNYTNDGTLGIASGTRTIMFKGSATQTVKSGGTGSAPNKRFVNIVMDKTGGSVVQSSGSTGDIYTNSITFTNGIWDNSVNNRNMTVTVTWTNSSTTAQYLPGTGTVTFNSTASRNILTGWTTGSVSAGKSFYNVIRTGTGGTHTLSGHLNVLNNISITGGTLNTSASNYDIYVGGNWSNSVGTTFTPNASTVTFNSSGNRTITSNGNKFYYVTISKTSGGKITLLDNFESLNKTTVTSGTLEVPANIIGKAKQTELQAGSFLNILSNGQFKVNE